MPPAEHLSQSLDPLTVCAVTVTYGNRRRLLEAVVARLLEVRRITPALRTVIVVDNGSDRATKEYLGQLAKIDCCRIVSLYRNAGSAAGFAAGLREAGLAGCNYIWLLDDDNLPEPEALEALLATVSAGGGGSAFLSLRVDRPEYVKAARDPSQVSAFGCANSFLGFEWREALRKLLRRGRPDEPFRQETIRLPYGPYGGLLLPSPLLPQLGLPRLDYHLYGDDHEFTHRLGRLQVPLILVPSSIVHDLEASWSEDGLQEKRYFLSPLVLTTSESDTVMRLYYSTRNRVHFETAFRVNSGVSYAVNACLKIGFVLAASCLASILRRELVPLANFLVFSRAVRHGVSGALGRVPTR